MTAKGRWALLGMLAVVIGASVVVWRLPSTQLSLAERELRSLPASAATNDLRVPGQDEAQVVTAEREINLAAQAIRARLDEIEKQVGPKARTMCLKARLSIAVGRNDDAIETLQLAESVEPGDACVAFATGLAFASRSVAENRAIDMGTAAEWFQRALEIDKQTAPEALYDLAWTAERLPAPHAALEFWRQAFKVEQSSARRAEIAKNSARCDRLISERLRQLQEVVEAADPEHVPDGGIDVLLQAAEADWLADSTKFHFRLERLAAYLQVSKHDPWLRDLLRERQAQSGLPLLAAATAANRDGRHEEAVIQAKRARTAFAGNAAGVIASSVELAFAEGRLQNRDECLDALSSIRAGATQLSYVWLGNRAWLQELACKSRSGNFDVMAERMDAAERVPGSGYSGLGLRAEALKAEPFVSLTTPMDAWQSAHESLSSFWNGLHAGPLAVNFYVPMALSADNAGKERLAAILTREAITAMDGNPNQRRISEIWSDWADAQMKRGKYSAASESYKNAALFALSLDETQHFEDLSEVAGAKAEIAAGRSAPAMERLQRLLGQKPFPYLDFKELERLQLIQAMGGALLATGRPPDALRYYKTVVNECLTHLEGMTGRTQRQAILSESEEAWLGMVETQIRSGDSDGALDSWQAFRGYRDPAYRRLPPTAGTDWLSYARIGNRIALWVSDTSGTKFQWIELGEIPATVQRLGALLANPDSSVELIHRLSRQLYQELLGPVAQRFSATSTLVIDAGAPLGNVPWAVLENDQGQPLIEQHAFVLSHGWYEAMAHASSGPLKLRPGLIIADPELDVSTARQLPPLLEAREESAALQRSLPETELIAGAAARVATVTGALPHERLLHYAGHGVSNGGVGALVLAREPGFPMRLLTAKQIADLDLSSTELAVLAACSSGVGEQTGGFDLSSLVRAFLEAGASRVVAARWNIDARPTARFMAEFYKGLLRQSPPAQAMRAAALAIRHQQATAHPYYWAAFEIYGGI